jgi:hypothetical protein
VKGRGHSFLDIEKQDLIPEMKKIGGSRKGEGEARIM